MGRPSEIHVEVARGQGKLSAESQRLGSPHFRRSNRRCRYDCLLLILCSRSAWLSSFGYMLAFSAFAPHPECR